MLEMVDFIELKRYGIRVSVGKKRKEYKSHYSFIRENGYIYEYKTSITLPIELCEDLFKSLNGVMINLGEYQSEYLDVCNTKEYKEFVYESQEFYNQIIIFKFFPNNTIKVTFRQTKISENETLVGLIERLEGYSEGKIKFPFPEDFKRSKPYKRYIMNKTLGSNEYDNRQDVIISYQSTGADFDGDVISVNGRKTLVTPKGARYI